jgi:hypothetical protein
MAFFPFFFNSDNYGRPIEPDSLCLLLQSPGLTQDGQNHFQELTHFPWGYSLTGHRTALPWAEGRYG